MYARKHVCSKDINNSLKILQGLPNKSSSNKQILNLMKWTQNTFATKKSIKLTSSEPVETRKKLIEIYNSTLYNALKRSNDKKLLKQTISITIKINTGNSVYFS